MVSPMKKVSILLICLLLLFCQIGCHNTQETESRTQVTINLPTDDRVNGYRVSSSKPEAMPEIISGEDTSVGTVNPDSNIKYCANKNSKVFHKLSCSSIVNTKNENKIYYSNRQKLIADGYSPCKRCNP